MANFKSKDVMTVSATIIAGLLILFTLQSISTNPILSKIAQMQEDLDNQNIALGSDIQTMLYLKSELLQIHDNQTKSHIQNQIEDLQMQTWQLQEQINGVKNEQSSWISLANQQRIAQNIQMMRATILGMIIPFALAIVVESSSSLRRSVYRLDETASNAGKNLISYGAIFLMIGAAIIMANWVL